MSDHYETLGVPPDASADDIKAAYRRAASTNHPDKGGNGEKMALVNKAYATLGDDERRAKYDAGVSDDEPQSAEDIARVLLRQLLAAAIDAPEHENCVKWAAKKLTDAQASTRDELKRRKAKVAKLKKRREAVSTKGGENLVHRIIDQQIGSLEAEVSSLTLQIEAASITETLLANYESSEQPEPEKTPFDVLRHALDGGTLGGRRRPFADWGISP